MGRITKQELNDELKAEVESGGAAGARLATHEAETVSDGVHGLTTDRTRKISFGTTPPTGGADGDVYFQYE